MEEIYIRSFDGAYLLGRLHLPRADGPGPAILFVHGGRGGQAVSTGDTVPPEPPFSHFLSEGYVVLEADYRRYHFGDEELEDVVAAYRYLASRPEVDPDRIVVAGGSHGGYLALMLAVKEEPAAVVCWAGLVDVEGIFYEMAKEMLPEVAGNHEAIERLYHNGHPIREESRLIRRGELTIPDRGGIGEECAKDLAYRWGDNVDTYRAYSPKAQSRLIDAPVLYVVGSEDGFKTEGEKLVNDLRGQGKTAIYSEHPGTGHTFWWGGERDEDGGLLSEYYRALEVVTRFLHEQVGSGGTRA